MATKKRKNFTLSDETIKELNIIPPGQRSKAVANGIKREVARAKRLKFLKKYLKSKKPIWSDKDHPDLMTLEDIANYSPLTWRKKVS